VVPMETPIRAASHRRVESEQVAVTVQAEPAAAVRPAAAQRVAPPVSVESAGVQQVVSPLLRRLRVAVSA